MKNKLVLNKIPTRCSISSLFFFVFCSTCFGRYIHPSSGASTKQAPSVQLIWIWHTLRPATRTIYTVTPYPLVQLRLLMMGEGVCTTDLDLAHISSSYTNDLYSYTIPACTVEAPDDGWMQRPKHVEQRTKKNKLDLLHLVGILFIKSRCTETRNS
jgi:hypothetical protein